MSRAEEVLALYEKVKVSIAPKAVAQGGAAAAGIYGLHKLASRNKETGNVARKAASKAMSGYHTAKSMSGGAVRKHLGIGG